MKSHKRFLALLLAAALTVPAGAEHGDGRVRRNGHAL